MLSHNLGYFVQYFVKQSDMIIAMGFISDDI